jgi:hypothetical protein
MIKSETNNCDNDSFRSSRQQRCVVSSVQKDAQARAARIAPVAIRLLALA